VNAKPSNECERWRTGVSRMCSSGKSSGNGVQAGKILRWKVSSGNAEPADKESEQGGVVVGEERNPGVKGKSMEERVH